ncbi:hypothetical protein [Marinobacterium mangrovicola]|uniref:Uncharacterized protein n=1 Tax=Marinobacterium mangrovicola TaxID=1476959 RepID=A0A4R1GD21_9GAMM|nr:hypothetical protein [Marinobacterium mangrovicola]TCK03639.1 hypothetical protein CLV83_3913 [Marinobacterium mangrovicola]
MDAYVIGNLTGRLLMSVLIVYLVVLCFNKFDFRKAAGRLKGIAPILSIIIVFILGLAANTV